MIKSFVLPNCTQKMLNYFEMIQKREKSNNCSIQAYCHKTLFYTFHKIPKLIPNLKIDLIKDKSKFDPKLLDIFVENQNFSNFDKKLLDIFVKEKFFSKFSELLNTESLTNFTTNFEIINIIWENISKHPKEHLVIYTTYIEKFKNELITYIDTHLKECEYIDELHDILIMYINNVLNYFTSKK